MAVSSRLQGLHQVAKKSMMIGFPLLERVSVLTVLPSMLFSVTAGSLDWAIPAKAMSVQMRVTNNFFIIICMI